MGVKPLTNTESGRSILTLAKPDKGGKLSEKVACEVARVLEDLTESKIIDQLHRQCEILCMLLPYIVSRSH